MAKESQYNASIKFAIIIVALWCFFSTEVIAQNTKGDKPAKAERSGFKLPKIKTKSSHGDRPYRGNISGRRRIRTRDKSSAAHITQNPTSNYNTQQPSQGDRAYQVPHGTNKRIRSSSAQMARNNVYPTNWAYTDVRTYKKKSGGDHSVFSANETMRFRQKRAAQAARRIARSSGGALSPSTSPYDFRKKHNERASQSSGGFWSSANGGRLRNSNQFSSNPSPYPRNGQRAASGRSANRSASRAHVTRGRKNVYWGKFKVKERAITTDIAGRTLRTADFHSLQIPSASAQARRRAAREDKAGGFLGQLFSPHAKDRSWRGNISGNSLRRSAPHDPQNAGSTFWSGGLSVSKRFRGAGDSKYQRSPAENSRVGSSFWSGGLSRSGRSPIYGFRGTGSASGGWNNSGRALSGRTPSSGWIMGDYQGNIKTRRPFKGGGSIKQLWNNSERPLSGRSPSSGWIVGTYQGNIKTRKPFKGGGSIKQLWNNGEQPLSGRPPSSGWIVGTYQGNIKTGKPLKGGGSIKQLWNNSERPLSGRSPSSGRIVGTYQGNIKTRKPLKGGGSIKQLWNNNEQPLSGRSPSSGWIVGTYQGNIRTRKPLKGGGSIKQLWNNHEQSITINNFGDVGYNYTGKIRTWGPDPKGGGSIKQSWNNKEKALNGKYFSNTGYVYTGNIRTWGPDPKGGGSIKQSWNNKEKPLNGKYFAPVSISTIEYSNKMQAFWRAKIMKEKLAGREPMKKYAHAPHSVKEALMVFSPTRVTMRVNDYQVSVKMFKPQGKNLHPDAQFAHSLRDNVKEERTFMMNLKLTWAKFFKKNDNQTKAVKDKVHRPRYDPKERDLWKDLYD